MKRKTSLDKLSGDETDIKGGSKTWNFINVRAEFFRQKEIKM